MVTVHTVHAVLSNDSHHISAAAVREYLWQAGIVVCRFVIAGKLLAFIPARSFPP